MQVLPCSSRSRRHLLASDARSRFFSSNIAACQVSQHSRTMLRCLRRASACLGAAAVRPSAQVCSLRHKHGKCFLQSVCTFELHSNAQVRTVALPCMLGASYRRAEQSAAKLASQGLPPLRLHTACTQQVGSHKLASSWQTNSLELQECHDAKLPLC